VRDFCLENTREVRVQSVMVNGLSVWS